MATKKPGPKKRVFGRLTVSLAKGQRSALRRLAAQHDQSLAQIVRSAVRRVIENNGTEGQPETNRP